MTRVDLDGSGCLEFCEIQWIYDCAKDQQPWEQDMNTENMELMKEFYHEIDQDDDCCLVLEEFTTMVDGFGGLNEEVPRECPVTTRGWMPDKVFDMVDED